MIDHRTWLHIIGQTTQEECRQLAALFTAMAEAPRDANWRASFTEKLALIPEQPEGSLAQMLSRTRMRTIAAEDALRETGWHPDQMRAELERRGYMGSTKVEG